MNTTAVVEWAGVFPEQSLPLPAQPLGQKDRDEVLTFLSARPLHTVIMAGWILDHGVVSPFHRGTFFGYRDGANQIKGVALIGRNTLFETHTSEALRALAEQAKRSSQVKMIMAEDEKLAEFSRYCGPTFQSPRALHREILFETHQLANGADMDPGLRPATLNDLDLVVDAHAEMVAQETGTDPRGADADGFRARCAARVERGRVWVCRKRDELVFKADVVSQASGICYIEGVWVNPAHRGRGTCRRCLASLNRKLLTQFQSLCAFADVEHPATRSLYLSAGYSPQSYYSKIYL